MNIEQKGIVSSAGQTSAGQTGQDIPLCSIFLFFQYSLKHDLGPSLIHCYLIQEICRWWKKLKSFLRLLLSSLMKNSCSNASKEARSLSSSSSSFSSSRRRVNVQDTQKTGSMVLWYHIKNFIALTKSGNIFNFISQLIMI